MQKVTILFLSLFVFCTIATANSNSIDEQRFQDLALLNQNLAPIFPSWPTKNINVRTFLNFDITPKTMQKTLAGEEHDYFALSNAGINVDAALLDYLMAHAGVAYFKTNKGQGDRYKTNYQNTNIMLDDAFVTLHNFKQQPFFLQGGLFYLPFGQYDRYAIIPTLANILSITRAAGVQAGVVSWHGFTGSVFLVQGQLKKSTTRIQGYLNYGAVLRYKNSLKNGIHLGGGVEYMYNLLNVNALSENPNQFSSAYVYKNRTDGIAAQAAIGYRWFTLFGQYITALHKSNDIILRYQTYLSLTDPVYGARPNAWDAGAKANFHVWNKEVQADFTYSRSKEMSGLYIFNSTRNHVVPKERYIAGLTVNCTRNFFVRLQWGHDWLYPPSQGDTGREGDDATIRFGAKFKE